MQMIYASDATLNYMYLREQSEAHHTRFTPQVRWMLRRGVDSS